MTAEFTEIGLGNQCQRSGHGERRRTL